MSVGRFSATRGNYAALEQTSLANEHFDGILLDLGISSRQIDVTSRGFSFREGVPLDMRMGPDALTDAAGFLNSAHEGNWRTHSVNMGMNRGRSVWRATLSGVERLRPFAMSDDLVDAIRGALGPRTGPGDFARLFQAVRIAVNDELESLGRALPALRGHLVPGGILAVIAYHSGEDRLVKQAFRDWSTACVCPPRQPQCICGGRALGTLVTKRALVPGEAEMLANPRARSARLRAWRAA